jgi:hypothetical protein
VLEEGGLAGARRGDDEGALALAQGGDEVNGAGAQGGLLEGLEENALLREERGEFVEGDGGLPLRRGDALDRGQGFESAVAVPLPGGAQGSGNLQAGLERVVAHQRDGNEQVVRSRREVVARPPHHRVIAEILDHPRGCDGGAGGEQITAKIGDEMALGSIRAEAELVSLQERGERRMRE